MKHHIEVDIKAKVDDKVVVLNYRRKPAYWEDGTIVRVNIGVDRNLKSNIQYDVLLDRRAQGRSRMFPEGGAPITLTVSDSSIHTINK